MVEFFGELEKKYPEVSIVFVSSDNDSKEWASYFQSMGDSWLALPYDAQEAKKSLSKAFEVEGIPSLVLLSSESEGRKAITTEGRDCVENGLVENFPASWDSRVLSAAGAGDVDALLQLLDDGAAIDQTRGDGVTPLWIACRNGRVDAARLLLERGADVDQARRKDGWTPLMVVCQTGQVEAVRLLLENGAEVDRAAEDGRTPLFVAKSKGHSSIVAFLEEHQK